MEHEIIFGESDDFDVVIRAFGAAEVAGFGRYLEALFGDPRWHSGMNALCDLTELDAHAMTVEDVRRLVDLHAGRDCEIGAGVAAIAAGSPVNYGLVRMWEALVEGRIHLRTHVFMTVDEARASLSPH